MVCGLPNFTTLDELCEDCIVGMHHRDPIPRKSSWRAGQILGLIHADICGPITLMSNSNKMYFCVSLITTVENHGCIF